MIAELRIFEDEPAPLAGLLRRDDGSPIQQADLPSTIPYRVFKYSNRLSAIRDVGGTEVGSEGSIVVADAILDEPEENNPLFCGAVNFRFDVPAERFAETGFFRVELSFPGLFAVWIVEVLPVASA
jgi:hypothetical protein